MESLLLIFIATIFIATIINVFLKKLDIPTCIRDYEGGIIDEKEFMDKLSNVAELAVGDACTGSNPRSINPDQMAKLLKCCYYDEEVDF